MSETLRGLVEHYSPSGRESAAVEWLTGRMRSLGYDDAFVDDAGNAVGVIGSGACQIVLLGHIDTVPGELPLLEEDGFFYGRGAVDAKGPLACFTDAAAQVGAVPGWQIVVIGAVEEERNSEGARFAAGQYRPDFAVIGEPNRWDRVALGYKGFVPASLTIRSEAVHSAGSGETACQQAVDAWQAVRAAADAYNADKTRAFDRILPYLKTMQSGEDGFSQWAQLGMDVRLPLEVTPADWLERLRALAPTAEITSEGFAISAWKCEKNTPLVRAFLGAIRAQGGTPSFLYKTGTADLNIVAPVWGCPALVYGPGDSALDHTPHERLSLAEYRQSVAVLATALRSLMGSA